ncbi:MAG: hypothetical protein L0271_25360 [Gemmatimonadetes bacterium]|nr:hypothetical protein [Gemmatimonadota bacterium]
MRSERFDRPRHGERESAGISGPGPIQSAGLTWFGVQEGGRVVAAGDAAARRRGGAMTVVFGTAHGPRLLEQLGSCACC